MTMETLDPALIRIESGLAATPPPTHEPIIAQMDNSVVQSLIDACSIYEYVQDAEGGIVRLDKGDKYPRIKRLISMVSPLESNTRYDINEARIAWFDSKHRIRKLRAHHSAKKDALAVEILDEIQALRQRVIKGDALMGHKQTHIQKISGAERKVTVDRISAGRSLLGRVTGR